MQEVKPIINIVVIGKIFSKILLISDECTILGNKKK